MDISRTRVVLRERAAVDVLDLGVRFIAQHWAVYAKMAALVLPPFFAASWLIARSDAPVLAWALSLFAMRLAGAPFTVLASRLVFEDEVSLWAVLKASLRVMPRLLLVSAMIVVFAALGLTMILPGVVVLYMTVFVVEVLALERAFVWMSFKRSTRIVAREAGQAVIASTLLALVHVIAVFVTDVSGRMIIAAVLESRAPAAIWDRGWSPLALAGFWLFVPYAATTRLFVYLDVRTRSEGWDIQTKFAALVARPQDDVKKDVRRAA